MDSEPWMPSVGIQALDFLGGGLCLVVSRPFSFVGYECAVLSMGIQHVDSHGRGLCLVVPKLGVPILGAQPLNSHGGGL